MKNNVVVLKNYQMTKELGKHHRLLCMTGEKRGEVYYLKSKRIVLGRSPKADIKVYDNQSSREHVELIRKGDKFILTDLNSNNGVIVNGNKVKQIELSNKDRIIVGKTVYKFEIVVVKDDELYENELSEEEEFEIEEDTKKRKSLYVLAAVVIFGLLSLDTGTDAPKRKKLAPRNDINDEFTKIQKERQFQKDKKVRKQLEVIMQRGIRELREKNYLRAISEFNMALIISPQNSRAKAYKRKAKEQFDEEVEAFFTKAGREFEALNYIEAIKSYCSIIKMLELYPDDERRKSAEKNIRDIRVNIGLEDFESRCN